MKLWFVFFLLSMLLPGYATQSETQYIDPEGQYLLTLPRDGKPSD